MDDLDVILKPEKCICFKDTKHYSSSFAKKNGKISLYCGKCGKIIKQLNIKEENLILEMYKMMGE